MNQEPPTSDETNLHQFLDGGDVGKERDVLCSQSVHILQLYQAPTSVLVTFIHSCILANAGSKR